MYEKSTYPYLKMYIRDTVVPVVAKTIYMSMAFNFIGRCLDASQG